MRKYLLSPQPQTLVSFLTPKTTIYAFHSYRSISCVQTFCFLDVTFLGGGRVTKKSDMRTWSNARGEGNLFSIDLLDEDGSEIKGTFFKQDADKWIEVLQEGQVYSFCGGRVKVRNVLRSLFEQSTVFLIVF